MLRQYQLPLMGVFVCLLGWSSQARALSCDGHLISRGDTRSQVRATCGEPLDVARRLERQAVVAGAPTRTGRGPLVATAVTIEIETWVYNFGPRRLMQRITFRDGQLERIESLGYGYDANRVAHPKRFVHLGDSRAQVRAAWGDPADTVTRIVEQHASAPVQRGLTTRVSTVLQVETWVFDFGPHRLGRRVVFEDGRVVSVETLRRG